MYKKTALANNIRIVSNEMKDRDSAAIGIWIGAGGRFEDHKNKGVAHFLEHILFKGTEKYSCSEIKELIEGVGGSLNAFTSEEMTCYYAKIPSKHLDRTFDVLSDMVFHPLITKEDVDKERTVILEEIKMYHDLPQHYVIELLEELMWPNHPLGMNLAGTAESVGQLTEKDLRAFHQAFYGLKNVVVAGCGRLKHEHLVELTKKKSVKLSGNAITDCLKAPNTQEKSKIKYFRKETEQMHVALGAFGLEMDHKDKHVYALLNIILGGNMSSRLFDEVREKRGLAYAIGSSAKSLKDTGMLMVRAGVDNGKIVEAMEVVLKELNKMKETNVSKNEFTRAKDYYLGQILLGLEDTLEHMSWIGEGVTALNKTRTLKEILKEVEKIKIGDIKRLADKIFNDRNMNLSVIGPLKDDQEKSLTQMMKV